MRDLFDDFMEELRRREAISRGEDPDRGAPRRKPSNRADDPDPNDPEGEATEADPDAAEGAEAEASDTDADDTTDPDEDRSDPFYPGGRRPGATSGRRPAGAGGRRPGGPRDGEGDVRPIRTGGSGGAGRQIALMAVVLVLVAVFLLSSTVLDLWTDALWFQSVGFDSVFWTRIGAQVGLFVGVLALALVVFLGNIWLAGRLGPPAGDGNGALRSFVDRINTAAEASAGRNRGMSGYGGGRADARAITFEADSLPDLGPLATAALAVLGVVAALVIAAAVGAAWETVLLWQNRVSFGVASTVTDPIFGRDIGFFLFELPFLRLVQGLFNAIVIVALLLTFGRYLVTASRGGLEFATPVRLHLAILGALLLLSVAFGYQLEKLELVYSTRGAATGVGYTDFNAQFMAFDVLTVVSGLAAAFLVGGALTRLLWPLGLTIGIWFLASIVVGRLYPEAIQRFTVVPNEFAQEERFIANNIAMTRLAFDLDGWDDRAFRGEAPITEAVVEAEADTFTNARLWDYRPLNDTLDQLQTVRRYYTFTDVDADRYQIDGEERQVWLSARELALEQNATAVGFTNQRIIFTHGIGAVMTPVNEVANEGQPRLFIGNLPPVSTNGAPDITEPRIYFGERPSSYIVTGAQLNEFDFPTGEGDPAGASGTETRWTGTSGIKLDTTLSRLLFAARFKDLDLLISDQLTNQSQLLFHRSLSDRLSLIAPFLRYDKDPYLVIDGEGRLVYVQDAYTVSDAFPNAEAFDTSALPGTGLGRRPLNYIRNSVKITMDAYHGTVRMYIADPDDPIIRAYAGIFPDLFEAIDTMPKELLDHLRVPEELFNVQTRVFGRYHVTDPQQFFRTDDLWTVPQAPDGSASQTLPFEAYYVVMRMPGETEPEFLLLQPMVPKGRPNMIAWMAARNDAPNYGQVRVYRFPAETSVFGPAQIEARIDQDPIISQQVSLWDQSGSAVIRGNLIVVPLGESLIYLQPVYLQSTSSSFPEFRRIIVASPRNVVWGATLSDAVRLLVAAETGGGTPSPSPNPTPTPDPGASPTPAPTASLDPEAPLPTDVAGLIEYAGTHFALAQAALRAGDFATYGIEIARVEAALAALDRLAPGLIPSPGVSASPAP